MYHNSLISVLVMSIVSLYYYQMIKHAWDGYVKFAFGENELKPISKVGHSAGVFGKTKMGATIVDSLDTLYIAGLMEEFEQAKNWVNTTFHIDQVIKLQCVCVILPYTV